MFLFGIPTILLKVSIVFLVTVSYYTNSQQKDTGSPIPHYESLGHAIITEFPVEKFDGASTNWFIQQHSNGTIFLSNVNGLYSFDGANWRKHKTTNQTETRQFVIDNDRIYIGAESEFGYFKAINNGELKYFSLLSELE